MLRELPEVPGARRSGKTNLQAEHMTAICLSADPVADFGLFSDSMGAATIKMSTLLPAPRPLTLGIPPGQGPRQRWN